MTDTVTPTSGSMPALDNPIDTTMTAQPTEADYKAFVQSAPRSKLFNRATGKSEVMPFDQIPDALKSGTHGYKKGTSIRVRDDVEGDSFDVPAEGITEALNAGLRLENPQEFAVREFLAKPSNQGLEGAINVFSNSALNEFAFGVPGVVDKYTSDPLDLAQREAMEEKFKFSDIGGSLTGILGNAYATRGANIGTKGLEYGGKALNKLLGRAATAEVGEQAAKQIVKSGIVQKTAEKAAEFGIEGAAYSAPAAITEAAFGNPDEAAQTILGSFGVGALFGGALGGGGAIIKKSKEFLADRALNSEKAKSVAYKLVGANAEQITKIQQFSPKVGEELPSYLGDFGRVDPKILGDSRKLEQAVTVRTNNAGAKLGEFFHTVDTSVDKTLSVADDIQRAKIEAAFPDFKQIFTKVEDELVKPNLIETIGANGERKVLHKAGMEAELTEAQKFLNDSATYIEARYGSLQPTKLAALRELRQDVKSHITAASRMNSTTSSTMDKLYRRIETELRDVVDNQVVPKIKEAFPELSRSADEIALLNRDYHVGSTIEKMTIKKANKELIAPNGIGLEDLSLAVVGKTAKRSAQYLLGKELISKYAGKFDLKALQSVNSGIRAQAKVVQEIPEVLSKKKKYSDVLKEAYDTILPEGSSIKGDSFRNINNILRDAFNIGEEEKTTDYEALYKKVADKMSTLSASPEYTAKVVGDQYAALDALGAPNLATSLNAYTINNLEYIKSIMPKPQSLPNPIYKQKPFTPSDRDMYKFARKMEIVNNPMNLIGNLEDGTLSADEVKVANDLYPYVLNKIRTKVTDYLATTDRVIPYQDRLKYSLLLGLDADDSTLPSHVLAYQTTYIKALDNDLPAQTNQSKSLSNYKSEDLSTQISRISSNT